LLGDLTYAKDIQDMFRIQMAFMQAQMNAFGEQAKSLGEAYIKAASGQTSKPPP
jgi:Phasin protein